MATLVLPFALTTCLWRRFDAAQVVDDNAPTFSQIQTWALVPFMVLAAINAGFVYASWTRMQRWARLVAGTLGTVIAFGAMELFAFRRIFDAMAVPKNAVQYLAEASAAGLAGLALMLGLCHLGDLLANWIRSRRAPESAHVS
jgi:hypothetical protein